jgi:mono/diheme cytochrome c family protein
LNCLREEAAPLLGAASSFGGRVLPMHILFVMLYLVAFTVSHAAADETSADRGERIYEKTCANCHGDDLQNNSGAAFDLRRLKADEHPRFVDSVLQGKKAMPSWQGVLTTQQIEDLWAYIRNNAYQQ